MLIVLTPQLLKVINIDTPEITALSGENDYYTITATGTPGKKIVYSKDLITWQDSNVFTNLQPEITHFM